MKKLIAQALSVFVVALLSVAPAYAQEVATEPVHSNPFADPVQPSVAAAAEVPVMTPANPKPLQDFTQYYAQRTATVTSGEQKSGLTYFWFSPEKPWAENAKFPLILVLHDPSGLADAGRYLITEAVRKQFPAFIAVPALPEGKRWADPGKMKSTVHALSEAVELVKQLSVENPAIDPSRIYVIGCGTGGTGAYGAAQLYSDVFAAAVPIAATWNPNEASGMKNIAIAAFHGEDDVLVPYSASGDTIAMAKHNGNNNAFFTKFSRMAHDCDSSSIYTAQLWDWLFKQHK